METVLTGLHGTQTASITAFRWLVVELIALEWQSDCAVASLCRPSAVHAVQALFTVTSYASSDGNYMPPTVNEVISVLNTAVARGRVRQHAVEQLEISGTQYRRSFWGNYCILIDIVSLGGCSDKPCHLGVVCMDVVSGNSMQRFQCGACPERYTGDGITCIRTQVLET